MQSTLGRDNNYYATIFYRYSASESGSSAFLTEVDWTQVDHTWSPSAGGRSER